MNIHDMPVHLGALADEAIREADDLLAPLLEGPLRSPAQRTSAARADVIAGVVVGELLALTDTGATPLVRYDGQPGSAALRARSTVDLHGAHIGAPVLLMFERGDPTLPIVTGLLRGQAGWPVAELDRPAQVDVDADGERLVVTAREQLVLRCGKASITLTKAGKVLIEGSYVLSKSSGVNRVKGGAVQLN